MPEETVLRYILSVLIVTILTAFAGASPVVKPVEGRAIWIDANSIPTNDTDMSAFVDSFAHANLNILIPETVRRGYTIYPSKLDEQDPKFVGYDPLAAMIREAHKRGMEVHSWVWVFRQGYAQNKGPIFTKHPEWMAVNKWGETLSANGGLWVCPSIPEARRYLLSMFKEIVTNYDVDGLNLDYIRFENQFPTSYCYNDSCREKYKSTSGIDPITIDPISPAEVDWHMWREDLVNTFVQQLTREAKAIRPEVKISASVGSMPDAARVSLLQNWPHWVNNKWVDFLTPMAYTADADNFRKMVASEKISVDERTILLPGIGLHTQKTVDPMLEQIEITRSMNTDGATLFASVYFKEPWQTALSSGPYPASAEIPFRKPGQRVQTLLELANKDLKKNPALAASYLNDAERLLGYIAYRATPVGYIAPIPPPLVIPTNVLPLPTATVAKTTIAPVIDGKLDDPAWLTASSVQISYTAMGQTAPVATEVRVAYDDTSLYVVYIASEPDMARLKAIVTKRDGPAFYDDSAELFLDPWAKRHEYFQLSSNTLGARFDAKVNNTSVNPDWTTASTQNSGGWVLEAAIPFASLGVTAPKPGDKWFANFTRNRWTTGRVEYLAWSVPYGSFHRPERFATLSFQ